MTLPVVSNYFIIYISNEIIVQFSTISGKFIICTNLYRLNSARTSLKLVKIDCAKPLAAR